jgi:electron transport complex protein RnfD
MQFQTAITPYLRPAVGVGQIMRELVLTLVPALIVYVWFFGWGILVNLALCLLTCAASEALVVRLRGEARVVTVLSDYSVTVTALLLAFALPPLLPWYVTVTASASAVLIAKHAYGGLGFNIFNPAMVGYVIVLITFPLEMSAWLPPRMGDIDYVPPTAMESLGYILTGQLPGPLTLDAITRATPLDVVRNGLQEAVMFDEARSSPFFGDFGGRGWEWIGNFIILGGIWMLYRGIIRWHIPVAVLAGVAVPATLDSLITSGAHPGPAFHLFSGATLLGAFYIATDPVSAATSPRGRLVYGFGIGFIAWSIRTWGGYPDGIAFGVLLMNMSVPLIDHFTVPRILGHER